MYIPCIYMVYTVTPTYSKNILRIYHVCTWYTMYVHGIYIVYTVTSTYSRNILCIYHVYTMYIHGYTWYIMCLCSTWPLMLGGGQGPIPPAPPAMTSPGRIITLILLHSCVHWRYLLLAKWMRRARLELKIAGKCLA